MKQFAFVGAGLCLLTSNALAMTGAELLQTDDRFAEGYVFGAVEHDVLVNDSVTAQSIKRLKCVADSKATSSSLTQAVRAYIIAHPQQMAMPAISSVIIVINEMCPAKP